VSFSEVQAQDIAENNFVCMVENVVPYISVTPAELKDATDIDDLSRRFKTSWVAEYKSVTVSTVHNGKVKKIKSKSDLFTAAQKEHMLTADFGTPINIVIKYIPNNNLSHNDVKELVYDVSVTPHKEAQFIGGEEALDSYLNESILSALDKSVLKQYGLAAVNFTVDELGQVVEAQVSESSNDEKTDKLILDAICQMPDWQPASYANGQKEKREFVVIVGDSKSCMTNTLGIKDFNKS